MKITKRRTTLTTGSSGVRNLVTGLITAACLFAASSAQAHLTYGGRDFGAFSGQTNGTKAITNQTCTGNYGWADAADGTLGDSHRGRAFRFRLDNSALVTLTVAPNPFATTNNPLGDLTPAFTLYSGLAAIAPFSGTQVDSDHDGSLASLAWRAYWEQNISTNAIPTDGCWNSLGDFKIGGDGDPTNDFSQLSTLIYKGSVASATSGGSVTGSFVLPAGNYTIIIGGNDIANKTAGTALVGRGISATLSVAPTPNLSIAPKVFVAWPSGTPTNWVLQSASSVNATNWTGVTNIPVIVDGQPGVVLDSGAAPKFFRWGFAP
jgi:hypothetical protein